MSAFHKPPKRSRHTLVGQQPSEYHMVAKALGGIGQLYQQIKDHTVPVLKDIGVYTDTNGCFDLGDGQCLLALRYKFVEVLGTGQSSVVIKAKDMFNSNKLVAIKILHTQHYQLGGQETDCYLRLQEADPFGFSHVCRLLNMFSFDDHYCMVFELLHRTDWISICHPSSPEDVYVKIRKVALRLLQVLGFLQQENVIHADLKPDNLLLKSADDLSSVCVADFGNAIHCVYDEVSLYYDDFELQTLLYRAPEVMFGLQFGKEIDMWSVGCILAELFMGKPLFCGSTREEVLQKMVQILGPVPRSLVQRGKFYGSLEMFTFCGSQLDATTCNNFRSALETGCIRKCTNYAFSSFLSQLLRYDPSERLSPSEAACHPFLAPEAGLGYLIPASTFSTGAVDQSRHYPSVLVSQKYYPHKPFIDKDILRQHPSSLDLLYIGTSSSCQTYDGVKRRIAEVSPLGFQISPGEKMKVSTELSSSEGKGRAREDPLQVVGTGVRPETESSKLLRNRCDDEEGLFAKRESHASHNSFGSKSSSSVVNLLKTQDKCGMVSSGEEFETKRRKSGKLKFQLKSVENSIGVDLSTGLYDSIPSQRKCKQKVLERVKDKHIPQGNESKQVNIVIEEASVMEDICTNTEKVMQGENEINPKKCQLQQSITALVQNPCDSVRLKVSTNRKANSTVKSKTRKCSARTKDRRTPQKDKCLTEKESQPSALLNRTFDILPKVNSSSIANLNSANDETVQVPNICNILTSNNWSPVNGQKYSGVKMCQRLKAERYLLTVNTNPKESKKSQVSSKITDVDSKLSDADVTKTLIFNSSEKYRDIPCSPDVTTSGGIKHNVSKLDSRLSSPVLNKNKQQTFPSSSRKDKDHFETLRTEFVTSSPASDEHDEELLLLEI